jgi:hypothetical protein
VRCLCWTLVCQHNAMRLHAWLCCAPSTGCSCSSCILGCSEAATCCSWIGIWGRSCEHAFRCAYCLVLFCVGR